MDNTQNTVVNNLTETELEKRIKEYHTLDSVITNLKIISNIKRGDKIFINDNNIIQIDDSHLQCINRYLYNRSRNITISFLKDMVNSTLVITDNILNNEYNNINKSESIYNENTHTVDFEDKNSDLLQKCIIEINNSYKGFVNLKKTYDDDVTINAELDVLIEQLKLRCDKITKVLQININK